MHNTRELKNNGIETTQKVPIRHFTGPQRGVPSTVQLVVQGSPHRKCVGQSGAPTVLHVSLTFCKCFIKIQAIWNIAVPPAAS